jgi:hypothetical protein
MGLADAVRSLRSRTSSLRAAAALAAAVPLLLALPAGPAAAAPGVAGAAPVAGRAAPEAATAAPGKVAPGAHCALGAGEGGVLTCFDSFPAAVAFATGGRVTTAPASPQEAVRDAAFTASVEATTAATVLVGIEYADLNYGGSSVSMYASGRCDDSPDADYRFPTLPTGWNDRISSFRSYSNCAQQLFDTTYYGGALTGIISSLSYVGQSANDRASSVTFN